MMAVSTTGLLRVVRRKCLLSSGRCQGRPPSAPITRLRATAAMSEINGLDRDRRLDARVVLVVEQAQILEPVLEDRLHAGVELEARERVGL